MKITFITWSILSSWLFAIITSCNVAGDKDNGNGGGIPDPVDHEPAWFGHPAWHPDGQWIAAEHVVALDTDDDGIIDSLARGGIWLVNAQTGELQDQPLLEWGAAPDWNPEGSQLVVHHNAQIFTVDVTSLDPPKIDTASIRRLTTEGRNFYPDWSPDGEWIAYDNTNCGSANDPPSPNSCGVLIQNLGDETRKLVKRYSRMPTWKPKNTTILFVNRAVLSDGKVIGDSLWTYNLADTTLDYLIFIEGDNHHPQYSPDGLHVAYLSAPPPPDPAVLSIWLMDAEGTNPRKISPDWSGMFSWSPDGSRIVFLRHNPNESEEGNGQLWLMDADGTNLRQLTRFNPDNLNKRKEADQ